MVVVGILYHLNKNAIYACYRIEAEAKACPLGLILFDARTSVISFVLPFLPFQDRLSVTSPTNLFRWRCCHRVDRIPLVWRPFGGYWGALGAY